MTPTRATNAASSGVIIERRTLSAPVCVDLVTYKVRIEDEAVWVDI